MVTEGPGPSGPGPSASAIERARQRIYGPDASPADVATYERLMSTAAPSTVTVSDPEESAGSPSAGSSSSEPEVPRRGRGGPILVVAPLVLIVLALIAVVLLPRGPTPLPDWLNPPSAEGKTITTLARQSNPEAAPDLITYQPQGYTVFQPAGHAVRVRIRCQGAGTVTIAAGRPFRFRCGRARSVQQEVGPSTDHPFVVIGTTHGNVVWAARITLD